VQSQLAPVWLNQGRECGLVARTGSLEYAVGHDRPPACRSALMRITSEDTA
jgi:hypothetical protein